MPERRYERYSKKDNLIENLTYPDNESLKKAHRDYNDLMSDGWKNHPDVMSKMVCVAGLIPPKSKILDVGCNSGEIMLFFQEVLDAEVTGIDIAYHLVRKARKKGLDARWGDAEKLPFASESFDCVFIGEVIEHSYEPEKILKECSRVLKGDGILVGTTFDELNKRNPCGWDDARLHAKPYGIENMKELLGKVFFDIQAEDFYTNSGTAIVPWIIFKGRKSNA